MTDDKLVIEISSKSDDDSDGAMAPQQRLFGSMEPFVLGENYEDYQWRLDNYFALNKVTDEDFKRRLLMNVIGATASTKVMKSLLPKVFTEVTYDEIVTHCKKLFIGERNSIVEHYKFSSRSQHDGETLSDYAVELQAIAEHCEFGVFLDTALRDRFVAGIRNTKIKQVLLSLDSKTKFEKTVATAVKEALVHKEATNMRVNDETSTSVNAMRANYKKRGRSKTRHEERSSGDRRNDRSESKKRCVNLSKVKCFNCQQLGHYSRDCDKPRKDDKRSRSKSRGPTENRTNSIQDKFGRLAMQDDSNSDQEFINHVSSFLGNEINRIGTALVNIDVDSTKLMMEIDTGSCVTVCAEEDFIKYFGSKKLEKASLPLTVVSGESLVVKGMVRVKVRAHGTRYNLYLHVIESRKRFTPLMGRDWLDKVYPAWRKAFKINAVHEKDDELKNFRENFVSEVRRKYAKLFDNDLSKPIKDFVVDIKIDENARPFVHKAYDVPFSLRENVSQQLDDMEKCGLIEKIEYTEWASPMVTVVKPNKDLRICIDGSKTINPHIETHHYPLPIIDELLANKSEAKYFCVLDLKGAYQQLIVSEATKRLLAINTIKGLYAHLRLPFGVKPAASIFQSVMDQILRNIKNVQAYIDDILIYAASLKELLALIVKVLNRLLEFNVKVNFDKCKWFVTKVKYLGHVLTTEGVAANSEGIKSITDAPEPQNASEVRSFVSLVMYYAKFIPKLSVKLAPLYNLLKKDTKWNWSDECQNTFNDCKREILSAKVLVHYDQKKPIVVTCDASDQGIGAVLSHRIDGHERPVFFVSRTLTKAEKKYPILHREALAVVFAMERFYKYVYGHFVEIFSDHKPLEGIFGAKKGEPPVVATRLQRYIMRMSIFDYTLKHRKGKDIGHADCLSRLPIEAEPSETDRKESECFEIKSIISGGPLTLDVARIKHETAKDPLLSKVFACVRDGWKDDQLNKELKTFFKRNHALSIECGCVVNEGRIVIPTSLKHLTMQVLHTNHLGIVKMKHVARQYVYWEGMTKDIETFVMKCEACQTHRKDKAKKEYGKWPETTFPFERVHIDFFHFKGITFLIMIDVYSHWLEVKQMNRTNAERVIVELEQIFSVFGYPVKIVSDNGPPFDSYVLTKYFDANGIQHVFSPPYHPASNGVVERAVQTIKSVLRKFVDESRNQLQMSELVAKFLKNYRHLPSTSGNVVPSNRIFSFKPRGVFTKLELPSRRVTFENCSKSQVQEPTAKKIVKTTDSELNFKKDEEVLYLSKLKGYTYSYKAKIIKKLSTHVYQINVSGLIKNAHVNQLRKSILKQTLGWSVPKEIVVDPTPVEQTAQLNVDQESQAVIEQQETSVVPETQAVIADEPRTARTRQPPIRLIQNWLFPTYD